jgi:hypothetical protein
MTTILTSEISIVHEEHGFQVRGKIICVKMIMRKYKIVLTQCYLIRTWIDDQLY